MDARTDPLDTGRDMTRRDLDEATHVPQPGVGRDMLDREALTTETQTSREVGDSDHGADTEQTPEAPGAIRHDIAQTRESMSRTIDSIQERLSPQRIVNEAKESVKDTVREATESVKESVRVATVGRVQDMATTIRDSASDASNSVMDTIRQNPIPAAMAGLGLGWLFYRAMQRPTPTRRAYTAQPPGYSRDGYADGYRDTAGYGTSRPAFTSAGNADQPGVSDRVSDAAQGAREKIGDLTGQVSDRVGQIGGQVQDRAGELGDRVQTGAVQTRDWFGDMMQENPLVMGLAAAAVGAAVGFAIKETPQENRFMGEAHDNLLHKAQDVAQDTAQKVQQVAKRAADTAKDEAQRQGLVNQS